MSDRLHWPSKWIFILAAIGSAAGLGNLWRFPYLAYENGGGAFVAAIIIANIIIGIPLLVLEVALGQSQQKGAPDAFGAIKKSFRYIGWAALILGFLVLAYYMGVLGWGVTYFFSSFSLAWGADTEAFFFNDILHISDGVGTLGGVSFPVLAGLFFAWALVYFSVWKGVRGLSKIVGLVAILPLVILGILAVRALTLEGASDGIRLFLLPDWSAFLSTKLWLAAFSQVFFSLSLAFGIMIAYGSYQKKSRGVTSSVGLVAIGNFLVSFLSGIVVFGTLGYMAHVGGSDVGNVVSGGPGLAFVIFPHAISLLPSFATITAVLFFGMFLLLGIGSAFSLLEAFIAALRDRFAHVRTKTIALILTLAGIVLGIPYATGAGLYYLDITDHFIVNYGLVLIGILESIVVGWFWKGDVLKRFIRDRSEWTLGPLWDISIKIVTPVFLTALIIVNLLEEFKAPYGGYPTSVLVALALLVVSITIIGSVLLERYTRRTKTGV